MNDHTINMILEAPSFDSLDLASHHLKRHDRRWDELDSKVNESYLGLVEEQGKAWLEANAKAVANIEQDIYDRPVGQPRMYPHSCEACLHAVCDHDGWNDCARSYPGLDQRHVLDLFSVIDNGIGDNEVLPVVLAYTCPCFEDIHTTY